MRAKCLSRKARSGAEQLSATSRRTASPYCRLCSSLLSARRRSSTSSSSTQRLLLRVSRNWWQPVTFMPGNSRPMCAWMTELIIKNSCGAVLRCAGTGSRRGKERGTCTMAISPSRPKASAPCRLTMKLSPLFCTLGKGWDGSSPNGVRTGRICVVKKSSTHCPRRLDSPTRLRMRMPSSSRAGSSSWLSSVYCSSTRACTSSPMRRSTSRASRPSGPRGPTSSPSPWRSPATRTSKNSSSRLDTMETKRTRSSSGKDASRAWASTRRCNATRDSSRLR